jgi:cellulose synthase/poly-beta-1,6-N-acetylglucosamine synthase-like glycosyltransferase
MNGESILLLVIAICGAGTLYAYVVFPAIAALLTRTSATRVPVRGARRSETLPQVTVIIPAYNEERSLDAKIRNVLATDYPVERLEIFVVSDASTDRTDAIARSFADRGVRLLVQEHRSGKTAGLNRVMPLSRGEIVVFTDANAMYSPSTIPTLMTYFEQSRVGLVTGYTRYVDPDGNELADTTNAYTSLEQIIKRAESRWGCCVGADGAIFAMRRSLFRPLRNDDINDLVLPLGVIEQGFACVLAADAYCTEQPGSSLDSEYRRQSRITNRTLRALWRHRGLLSPIRDGRFAFFLFSHKVVRFLVPIFLVSAFIALALLARVHPVYLAAAALVSLGVAAALGVSRLRVPWTVPARLLSTMGVFLTINAAVLEGWWTFLRGRREVVWQHDRSGG